VPCALRPSSGRQFDLVDAAGRSFLLRRCGFRALRRQVTVDVELIDFQRELDGLRGKVAHLDAAARGGLVQLEDHVAECRALERALVLRGEAGLLECRRVGGRRWWRGQSGQQLARTELRNFDRAGNAGRIAGESAALEAGADVDPCCRDVCLVQSQCALFEVVNQRAAKFQFLLAAGQGRAAGRAIELDRRERQHLADEIERYVAGVTALQRQFTAAASDIHPQPAEINALAGLRRQPAGQRGIELGILALQQLAAVDLGVELQCRQAQRLRRHVVGGVTAVVAAHAQAAVAASEHELEAADIDALSQLRLQPAAERGLDFGILALQQLATETAHLEPQAVDGVALGVRLRIDLAGKLKLGAGGGFAGGQRC
jgi:hypothetical protein